MGRKETIWGAYDISLEEEMKDYVKKMKEIGIERPTKIEASILISKKARSYKLTPAEIKEIIRRKRGL
jgi:hypothetical protein